MCHGVSGLGPGQIWVMVERGKRPNVGKRPADVPASLTTIMTECWAQEPNKRPAFNGKLKHQYHACT